jgi:hypothetical protein
MDRGAVCAAPPGPVRVTPMRPPLNQTRSGSPFSPWPATGTETTPIGGRLQQALAVGEAPDNFLVPL